MDEGPLFFATRAHLLLCTGPRCARRGSPRVLESAWRELESRALAYYKRGGSIRLTESGCLGQCSHGPTLVAYHADDQGETTGALRESWYVGVDAPQLVDIAEALHRGGPPPGRGRFGPR